jgi:FkbM family methyltransferase
VLKQYFQDSFLATLSRLTANRLGQSLLNKTVLAAQYAQGIGSGGDVAVSGEAWVFRRLKDRTDGVLCIFDVGANKGQWLDTAFNGLAGREFVAHSFEPSRHAFAQLCENAGKHTNATLNNCGLGRETGEGELFYEAAGSGHASLTRRRLDHIGVQMDFSENVGITTIDHYCGEHGIERIDLLKIDVEGHEMDVLSGATEMFRKSAIKMVTFEFGGCNIDTRTFVQDFFYFFDERHMAIARISPTGYMHELRSYKELHEQFRNTNFFCWQR